MQTGPDAMVQGQRSTVHIGEAVDCFAAGVRKSCNRGRRSIFQRSAGQNGCSLQDISILDRLHDASRDGSRKWLPVLHR